MKAPYSLSPNAPFPTLAHVYLNSTAGTGCTVQLGNDVQRVVSTLAARLQSRAAWQVREYHLQNFVLDPNASDAEVTLRASVVGDFWQATGNGLFQPRTRIQSPQPWDEAGEPAEEFLGPVLSVDESRMLLGRLARPFIAPYLCPRLFHGLKHQEAIRYVLEVEVGDLFPVVLASEIFDTYRTLPRQPTLEQWLRPFEPLVGHGGDHETLLEWNSDAESCLHKFSRAAALIWDQGLPTRTFAAYRLALTGKLAMVAAETDLPIPLLDRNFCCLVSHEDAVRYFDSSPSVCGHPDWALEVAMFIDWDCWNRFPRPNSTPATPERDDK